MPRSTTSSYKAHCKGEFSSRGINPLVVLAVLSSYTIRQGCSNSSKTRPQPGGDLTAPDAWLGPYALQSMRASAALLGEGLLCLHDSVNLSAMCSSSKGGHGCSSSSTELCTCSRSLVGNTHSVGRVGSATTAATVFKLPPYHCLLLRPVHHRPLQQLPLSHESSWPCPVCLLEWKSHAVTFAHALQQPLLNGSIGPCRSLVQQPHAPTFT